MYPSSTFLNGEQKRPSTTIKRKKVVINRTFFIILVLILNRVNPIIPLGFMTTNNATPTCFRYLKVYRINLGSERNFGSYMLWLYTGMGIMTSLAGSTFTPVDMKIM